MTTPTLQLRIPEGLLSWTADQIAECLSYDKYLPKDNGLYAKLWKILGDASNPTPLGGDGSNGTVQTPSERHDEEHDDKAPAFWSQLTHGEQKALLLAYREWSI